MNTEYVILSNTDDGGPRWQVLGQQPARSADSAIRAYIETEDHVLADDASGAYVAVPARSWKPVQVKVDGAEVLVTRMDELPCPYCWASAAEPCSDECPQYPISALDGVVVADARTLGKAADDLSMLRGDRKRPPGVAESWEAYDV